MGERDKNKYNVNNYYSCQNSMDILIESFYGKDYTEKDTFDLLLSMNGNYSKGTYLNYDIDMLKYGLNNINKALKTTTKEIRKKTFSSKLSACLDKIIEELFFCIILTPLKLKKEKNEKIMSNIFGIIGRIILIKDKNNDFAAMDKNKFSLLAEMQMKREGAKQPPRGGCRSLRGNKWWNLNEFLFHE